MMLKDDIVTESKVTLDTASEVEVGSPDFARRLRHAGARYGGGGSQVVA